MTQVLLFWLTNESFESFSANEQYVVDGVQIGTASLQTAQFDGVNNNTHYFRF